MKQDTLQGGGVGGAVLWGLLGKKRELLEGGAHKSVNDNLNLCSTYISR
jgi:hypothetical protein